MTDLMDEAIEALRHVPAESQDDLARLILQLAGREQPLYVATPEEEAALVESEADRRAFATDEQVRAISAKQGL